MGAHHSGGTLRDGGTHACRLSGSGPSHLAFWARRDRESRGESRPETRDARQPQSRGVPPLWWAPMATPPQLTPEQRTAALAKAAEARTARAELKNKLKLGTMSLREALASTDSTVGKLKVVSLLESLPGVGKVKARKIMEDIGIADNRRVQGLGQQQKATLLELLAK